MSGKEVWNICIESDKYEVSNTGYVRNRYTKHILKPQTNYNGYLRVRLDDRKLHYIHRLVYKSFVKCDENVVIKHTDGDKTNNNLINLYQKSV